MRRTSILAFLHPSITHNQNCLMDADYLIGLFDYDSDVNQKLLGALRDTPEVGEPAMNVFAHLLAAKKVWMARLSGEQPSIPVWPSLDLDACAALIEENRAAYTTYLQDRSAEHLAADVQYQNSKGVAFRNQARDILMHVLVHSGYHRGQIAQSVRQAGGEPVNTGYIFYRRT